MSAVQAPLRRDSDLRAEVEQLRAGNKALTVDLANLQTDLLAKNREIGRLRTELSKARGEHRAQGDANEVFDYWCGKLNKRQGTKFGEKRQAKVKARLREGFSTDDLRKAIDGCARFPFVTKGGRQAEGKGRDRYDDLELICRDETTVERFMVLAEREVERPPVARRPRERVEKRGGLELADQLEFSHGLEVKDLGHGRWMAQCPAHDDKTPSLSIRECEDGTVLVHCFGGCSTEAVVEAVGWRMAMLRARS